MNKIIIALVIPLLFAGCKKTEDSVSKTNFQLRLTDAPGDFEEVNIDIISAQVHINDGIGWTTLTTKTGIYNLLDLTNGKDTLIASSSIPSGRISQIRLILGNNNTVKVDGEVYQLKIPSGMQSGLKINIHADLAHQVEYIMMIDFDAGKSIVKTGNNEYQLKPVIRAFPVALTGGIKGFVDPAASSPVVYAIKDTDTTTTFADINGYFAIMGLVPEQYIVVIVPDSGFTNVTIPNVSVSAGSLTDLGTIQIPG